MTAITVRCSCGTRVRAAPARLLRRPPCPDCGRALPGRPDPRENRRIPFECLCGLKMGFPWDRGGLWFECPQCGRKSIIPGRGSSLPRPVSLPGLPPTPPPVRRRRVRAGIFLAVATLAVLAGIGLVMLLRG